jgi:TRAP-type C4-dicarboxylate transport system permease small subunit
MNLKHREFVVKIDHVVTIVNRRTAGVLATIAAFVIVAWVLVMVAGIVGRAFLGLSWMFLEEFTAYFNLLVKTFGLGYAVVYAAHISVSVIVVRLAKRLRLALEFFTVGISVFWGVILTQKMIIWASDAVETAAFSPVANIPLWIPYFIAVVGLGGFALATLLLLLHLVATVVQGEY